MKDKETIFRMRPTGKMHIGHYFGDTEKLVELQEKYIYFKRTD